MSEEYLPMQLTGYIANSANAIRIIKFNKALSIIRALLNFIAKTLLIYFSFRKSVRGHVREKLNIIEEYAEMLANHFRDEGKEHFDMTC